MKLAPIVMAQMLIRCPVEQVFSAFTDPDITSKFWFSRGSAALEPNANVTWYWDWYGVSANVKVLQFSANELIQIEWGEESQLVFWEFQEHSKGTLVKIQVEGFVGSQEKILTEAVDSKGGFSLVLAGAKAYLEHGIELQLVPDQNPAEGT